MAMSEELHHPSKTTRKWVSIITTFVVPIAVIIVMVVYTLGRQHDYNQRMKTRDKLIESKDQLIEEKDQEITEKVNLIKALEQQISLSGAEVAAIKNQLDELKGQQRLLIALIDESPYPTAALGAGGNLIYWNAAAEQDTGYSMQELKALGKGVEPIIPLEMQPKHREQSEAALKNKELLGTKQNVICRRVRKNGKSREVEVTVRFYMDKGELIAVAQWLPTSKVTTIDKDGESSSP